MGIIRIFNTLWEEVYRIEANSIVDKKELNVKELPSGLYWLVLSNPYNKILAKGEFVISR